jgi:hypothetical protein
MQWYRITDGKYVLDLDRRQIVKIRLKVLNAYGKLELAAA